MKPQCRDSSALSGLTLPVPRATHIRHRACRLLLAALAVCACGRRAVGEAREDPLRLDLGAGVSMDFTFVEAAGSWVGTHEVSNRQYRRFRPDHSSGTYGIWSLDEDDQPAVQVSWEDAVAFAAWVGKHGAVGVPSGYRVWLPSEAQWLACATNAGNADYPWELSWPSAPLPGDLFALVATDWGPVARWWVDKEYPWGATWPPPAGWALQAPPVAFNFAGEECARLQSPMLHCRLATAIPSRRDNYPVTSPVQLSGATAPGLFGLSGNVWEWCDDWLDAHRRHRALRGGAWDCVDGSVHQRSGGLPDERADDIGLRLIIAPEGS